MAARSHSLNHHSPAIYQENEEGKLEELEEYEEGDEEEEEEEDEEEEEEDEEEEEEEEEPKLKYQRLGSTVTDLLRDDIATAMDTHDKFLALGTKRG